MTVTEVALKLIRAGIPIATVIVDAVDQEMELSGSGAPPTEEQQATIDAGLQAAHATLQGAQQAP
jgi:hypothetical protein